MQHDSRLARRRSSLVVALRLLLLPGPSASCAPAHPFVTTGTRPLTASRSAEVNGQPTPDLDAFLEVVRQLPDGADVRVRLVHFESSKSKVGGRVGVSGGQGHRGPGPGPGRMPAPAAFATSTSSSPRPGPQLTAPCPAGADPEDRPPVLAHMAAGTGSGAGRVDARPRLSLCLRGPSERPHVQHWACGSGRSTPADGVGSPGLERAPRACFITGRRGNLAQLRCLRFPACQLTSPAAVQRWPQTP